MPCVGEMTVPETLGACPVTAIGRSAFEKKKEILKMVLPAGITSIGGSAFASCSALTEINIPDSVISIGSRAFDYCSSLRQMELPDSLTSLGEHSFSECRALESMRLSPNLTLIPERCFCGCNKLMAIEIPDGVTNIDDFAFMYCSAATTLSLPKGLKSVGAQSFYGCRGLKVLSIPNGTIVAVDAFVDCCNLTKIEVADGNTSVKVVDGCLVSYSGTALMATPSGNEFVKIPEGIVMIPGSMFANAYSLKKVALPNTLQSVGYAAFDYCESLEEIEFPVGFSTFVSSGVPLSSDAFRGCYALKHVVFNGSPPANVDKSKVLNCGRLLYPREYGAEWQKLIDVSMFAGYVQPNNPKVRIVSAAIRENDSTVMDVVYKVTSVNPTVKVRALVFQDGERSFAKVVRPTEFVEDTAKNIGDSITANEEHKLSWRVSADLKVDLAKVKFEVLAVEDDLLPLELTTIPKVGDHAAMEISWNAITEQQVFDALLWLYADGDEGLELADGALKRASDGYLLGYGTTASIWSGRYSKNVTGNGSAYYYFAPAIDYVYSKMGFSVLSGDELKYANEMTRLGLNPSGIRQYAWRTVEE